MSKQVVLIHFNFHCKTKEKEKISRDCFVSSQTMQIYFTLTKGAVNGSYF